MYSKEGKREGIFFKAGGAFLAGGIKKREGEEKSGLKCKVTNKRERFRAAAKKSLDGVPSRIDSRREMELRR